ncbi:hypothetical protein [Galbibacter pacificus]|uniref:Uncharacterized protein n=1 Tax=Galbibacter pacificus TaxID=2996052 RepID=A0ABT6FRZ5_9FLAO|nr:hypothetical protein [Galbibacter pacificus]MDG3582866.1 hypothetical protein [Galbibacter pacificus]MDG3586015.1 hypothetical protein [Galbibacter pacificus]
MNYRISSGKFTHPLLKPILLELIEYYKEAGISFCNRCHRTGYHYGITPYAVRTLNLRS